MARPFCFRVAFSICCIKRFSWHRAWIRAYIDHWFWVGERCLGIRNITFFDFVSSCFVSASCFCQWVCLVRKRFSAASWFSLSRCKFFTWSIASFFIPDSFASYCCVDRRRKIRCFLLVRILTQTSSWSRPILKRFCWNKSIVSSIKKHSTR